MYRLSDFSEALAVTANVKQQFKDNFDDLFARGDRLIRESVEAGVTVMRTHIESDATVGDICLKAGAALKEKWSGVCDIQLCRKGTFFSLRPVSKRWMHWQSSYRRRLTMTADQVLTCLQLKRPFPCILLN